jgi:phosphoserine phosphatase
MRSERTLNLRGLYDLSGRQALDSLQPPQVVNGHDRRLLTSKTDHLVRPTRMRDCWLRGHAAYHNGTRRRAGADYTQPTPIRPGVDRFAARATRQPDDCWLVSAGPPGG